jgi:hypothetical protein
MKLTYKFAVKAAKKRSRKIAKELLKDKESLKGNVNFVNIPHMASFHNEIKADGTVLPIRHVTSNTEKIIGMTDFYKNIVILSRRFDVDLFDGLKSKNADFIYIVSK